MAIPADVQLRQIKKNLVGKEGAARVKVLKQALEELPGYYSGPHGKLRKWIMEEIERSRVKRGVKGRDLFQVPKEGHRQIIILGQPNAGKSSLLKSLTGRQLKVADYPFATLTPTAATLNIRGAQLQLVEIPGLIQGVNENKGMGRALLAAARSADSRVLAVNLEEEPESLKVLLYEMELGDLDCLPIILGTRMDRVGEEKFQAWKDYWPDLEVLPCSTLTGQGLEEIRDALWDLGDLIQVYSGDQSGMPERKASILDEGATMLDFARSIHKDMARKVKFARVWGGSAKFPGQRVGPDHVLQDGDTVHLEIR